MYLKSAKQIIHLFSLFAITMALFVQKISYAAEPQLTEEKLSIHLPLTLKYYQVGPGDITGFVVDAILNKPINGAVVCSDSDICDVTNEDGVYHLTNISGGWVGVEATRSGFLPLKQDVKVIYQKTSTLDFTLSPSLSIGEYRIVLTWGRVPKDLDAHFWLPYEDYPHLYLDHPGVCNEIPFACLDRDDRDGNGPETISITELAQDGIYSFAVLNYYFGHPGVPDITESGAKVQVYGAEGLIMQFFVPETGDGDLWYVFDLNSANGEVTSVNCITYYPSDPDRPQCEMPLKIVHPLREEKDGRITITENR